MGRQSPILLTVSKEDEPDSGTIIPSSKGALNALPKMGVRENPISGKFLRSYLKISNCFTSHLESLLSFLVSESPSSKVSQRIWNILLGFALSRKNIVLPSLKI